MYAKQKYFSKPLLSSLLAKGAFLLLLFGCGNLQKDIEVNFPAHQKQLVVECYLQDNQPYRLLLTESDTFLGGLEFPDVLGALVTITHKDITDTLRLSIAVDINNEKLYNYTSSRKAVFDTINPYFLRITDGKGRLVTGETKFISPITIDTLEYKFNETDTMAYLLTKFTDNGTREDFYRYMVYINRINKNADLDFILNDKFMQGKTAIGSSYRFKKDDTLFSTLYRIDKDYYSYLTTVQDAKNANGNPLAQPVRIKSTVKGGYGVFTALSYDRKMIFIK